MDCRWLNLWSLLLTQPLCISDSGKDITFRFKTVRITVSQVQCLTMLLTDCWKHFQKLWGGVNGASCGYFYILSASGQRRHCSVVSKTGAYCTETPVCSADAFAVGMMLSGTLYNDLWQLQGLLEAAAARPFSSVGVSCSS